MHPDFGRPYPGTAADDVWALGVFLYAVLTGDVPWRTPPHRRLSLVQEMLRRKPRHPSDVNPAVPRALGDIALRFLVANPTRRPSDAAVVVELLEPVLRTAPVTGCVPARRGPRAAPVASGFLGKTWALSRVWPAWVRPKELALAATILLAFGLGVAWRRGLEELARGHRGEPTPAAAASEDPKPGANLPAALPVPSEPLPGQMQAPCPKKYLEVSGGCWDEIQVVRDGKQHPCPDDNEYVRELKEKDGRVRCLIAVMSHRPMPSTEVPKKSKH